MLGVGALGGAGALLFLVSALGDNLGIFMADWDWPKLLGRSSMFGTPDTEDRPCGQRDKYRWWSQADICTVKMNSKHILQFSHIFSHELKSRKVTHTDTDILVNKWHNYFPPLDHFVPNKFLFVFIPIWTKMQISQPTWEQAKAVTGIKTNDEKLSKSSFLLKTVTQWVILLKEWVGLTVLAVFTLVEKLTTARFRRNCTCTWKIWSILQSWQLLQHLFDQAECVTTFSKGGCSWLKCWNKKKVFDIWSKKA